MVKGKSQSLEGIYKFIAEYEKKYNIKFGTWEGLSLGNIDPHRKPHKLVWCERKATTNVNHTRRYAARGITPFDGIPYIFLGETFRRCAYGVYRYIKHFHNKRSETRVSSHRFCTRSSLYCGCPGIIVIREVYKFPELKIEQNTQRLRFVSGRRFSQRWAARDIDGQRWFYFFISPLREHENHEVPSPGGCTVEPFTEDKLVILNESGEVIGFDLHDPDNPSADPDQLQSRAEESLLEPAVKRKRLDAGPPKSALVSSAASSALFSKSAPVVATVESNSALSYEDSLLNHEHPATSTPTVAPTPSSLNFRPIQPRTIVTSSGPSHPMNPSSSIPVTISISASASSASVAHPRTVTPARVVRLVKEPRKGSNQPTVITRPSGSAPPLLPLSVVNSTNAQLKNEMCQLQKRTDARLTSVEERLSSLESRMGSIEAVMLEMSAQLRNVQALLQSGPPHTPGPGPAPSPVVAAVPVVSDAPPPVVPPELVFECGHDDVVPLEPFSPASLSDEGQK